MWLYYRFRHIYIRLSGIKEKIASDKYLSKLNFYQE